MWEAGGLLAWAPRRRTYPGVSAAVGGRVPRMTGMKRRIASNRVSTAALNKALGKNSQRIRGTGNTIQRGTALLRRVRVTVHGDNNRLTFDEGARLANVTITVRGNGHRLHIGAGVRLNHTELAFEDAGCTITIGAGTTIDGAHIAAAESGSAVTIGEDCMFSQGIYIATTDSHSILDAETRERINPAKDVTIGDHVWIGGWAKIVKGVTIEDSAIVGLGSVVTHSVPAHTAVAGNPARVVRKGVDWVRPRI